MNAPSYDKRMENLPLFISYPRSGSNWLNCILELYFDRPRLLSGPITLLKDKSNRKDYMWFHDHDRFSKLKIGHNNILYLYRNPVNVIYSLLIAEHNNITAALVNKEINYLKVHHEKYLNGGSKMVIKYEDLKNDLKNFSEVMKFFGNNNLDIDRLIKCNSLTKKDILISKSIDKRYFGKNLIESKYENERKRFKSNYGKLITKEFE